MRPRLARRASRPRELPPLRRRLEACRVRLPAGSFGGMPPAGHRGCRLARHRELFYNSHMSSRTVVSCAEESVGRFGGYGGRYVPESLIPACQAVADAFAEAWADPG